MTLIQSIHLGGIGTIITSDTRRISKIFTEMVFTEETSKIKKLTENLLFAGGGAEGVTDFIFDELKKYNIEELEDVLKFADKIEKNIEKELGNYLPRDWYAQALISGFDKDGQSGYVTYDSSREVNKFKIEYLDFFEEKLIQFAPKESVYDAAESSVEDILITDLNQFVEKMIEKFAAIQYQVWKNDNRLVSEIFHYRAIYVDPETNERQTYKGKVNLKKTEGKVKIK